MKVIPPKHRKADGEYRIEPSRWSRFWRFITCRKPPPAAVVCRITYCVVCGQELRLNHHLTSNPDHAPGSGVALMHALCRLAVDATVVPTRKRRLRRVLELKALRNTIKRALQEAKHE